MQRSRVAGMAVITGVGLWLLSAGQADLPGVDPGHAGIALVMAATWGSRYMLGRLTQSKRVLAMSPGECTAGAMHSWRDRR